MIKFKALFFTESKIPVRIKTTSLTLDFGPTFTADADKRMSIDDLGMYMMKIIFFNLDELLLLKLFQLLVNNSINKLLLIMNPHVSDATKIKKKCKQPNKNLFLIELK